MDPDRIIGALRRATARPGPFSPDRGPQRSSAQPEPLHNRANHRGRATQRPPNVTRRHAGLESAANIVGVDGSSRRTGRGYAMPLTGRRNRARVHPQLGGQLLALRPAASCSRSQSASSSWAVGRGNGECSATRYADLDDTPNTADAALRVMPSTSTSRRNSSTSTFVRIGRNGTTAHRTSRLPSRGIMWRALIVAVTVRRCRGGWARGMGRSSRPSL